jgi:hypothetical protein
LQKPDVITARRRSANFLHTRFAFGNLIKAKTLVIMTCHLAAKRLGKSDFGISRNNRKPAKARATSAA